MRKDVNIEVEAKVRVAGFRPVRDRLQVLGALRRSHVLEHNMMFDRSCGELRKRGERLRLRIVTDLERDDAHPVLTFKGKRTRDNDLKQRREVEVGVTDPQRAIQLLGAMGFTRTFSYEKRRESWELDNACIELDKVPLLGRFVEVESSHADHVHETLRMLGLADHPTVRRGYVGLLRRHMRREGLSRDHVSLEQPVACAAAV